MNDQPIAVELKNKDNTLKVTGLIVTALWLVIAGAYSHQNWTKVSALDPEDLATFLGGVFAPLAFLWLVLGYFQQGEELRHSVEALRLQAVELRNSVEQQRELVNATRDQIEHERSVSYANEQAAAQAAAPLFRLQTHTTHTDQLLITRQYLLKNLGTPVRDVKIVMEPNDVKIEQVLMSEGHVVYIDVRHPQHQPVKQRVTISYRDARNVAGQVAFEIPIKQVAGYGNTTGDPYEVPTDEQG